MKPSAQAIRRMFDTVSLGSPENAVGFVLWRITARYQREMDRALEPLDLTNLQFVALALTAWFGREGKPIHQAQLARFGGIHPMQLSLLMKALQTKGLVERTPSATDSRAKDVSVTTSGLQTLRRALPVAMDVQKKLFGDAGRPGGSLHRTVLQLDGVLNELPE